MRSQESYDISMTTTGSTMRCQESYDISTIKFGASGLYSGSPELCDSYHLGTLRVQYYDSVSNV